MEELNDERNVWTVLVLVAVGFILAAVGREPSHRAMLIAIAWVVVTYLPASNALFPVGFLG